MDTQKKVKLPYRIITMLLAIVMCVTCVPDLTAFAGSNGGGGGGNGNLGGSQTINYGQWGYRFYIIDDDQTIICIKDVLADTCTEYNSVSSSYKFYGTQLGDKEPLDTTANSTMKVSQVVKNAKAITKDGVGFAAIDRDGYAHKGECAGAIPEAFDTSYYSDGTKFRWWMDSATTLTGKSGDPVKNSTLLVASVFGAQQLKAFQNKDYYLVVEPTEVIRFYKENNFSSADHLVYCSAYEFWAHLKDKSGKNAEGGQVNKKKCMLMNGFMLSNSGNVKDFGVTKPTTKLTSSDTPATLASKSKLGKGKYAGYGMHIYWLAPMDDGGDPIHTYDIDTNPKKPANTETPKNNDDIKNDAESAGRKNGEVEIVKLYGYAYKRSDYSSTNKRYVKVEQTDNRLDGNGNKVQGYYIQKQTTDKILKDM